MTATKSNRQKTREKFRRKVIDEIRNTGGLTSLKLSSSPATAKALRSLMRDGLVTIERDGFPNYKGTINETKAKELGL